MNEFEVDLLYRLQKLQEDMHSLSTYLMDMNLIFTTIAAKYTDLEDETTKELIRKVRERVLDVYLCEVGDKNDP